MLPIVKPCTFQAQCQKLLIDHNRDPYGNSARGMLIRVMKDNPELAADLLEDLHDIDMEPLRLLVVLMVAGVYKSLEAQAESNELMRVG
jgi:hypothetical protein